MLGKGESNWAASECNLVVGQFSLPELLHFDVPSKFSEYWFAFEFLCFQPYLFSSIGTSSRTFRHSFLVVHESACGRRLRLIGFCYLCNCFNHPITINRQRESERERKIETGKQKKERRMRQGEMQPISAESLWQRFIFILNDYRRMNCGRNNLSCSEMLRTLCYQPGSPSNLLYSGFKSILKRVKGHTRQSKSSLFSLFSKPLHTVGLRRGKSPVRKLKSKDRASWKRGGAKRRRTLDCVQVNAKRRVLQQQDRALTN